MNMTNNTEAIKNRCIPLFSDNDTLVIDNGRQLLLLTQEQAEAIAAGNKTEYDRFFLANYELFRRMAHRWIHSYIAMRKYKYFYLVDEIVDELYLDLFHYCEFTKGCRWILYFIKKRCLWSITHGGLYYLTEQNQSKYGAVKNGFIIHFCSLDAPLKNNSNNFQGEDRTLGSILPFKFKQTDLHNKIKVEIILAVLRDYLSGQQYATIAACISNTDRKYINDFLKDKKSKDTLYYSFLRGCEQIFNNWNEIIARLAERGITLKERKSFTLTDMAAVNILLNRRKQTNERNTARRDERNAYQREYFAKNKEKAVECARRYREKNKEKIKAKRRELTKEKKLNQNND